MYTHVLVPVDNSAPSQAAIDAATTIATVMGSTIVGIHVYAARLHQGRFRQMEGVLPPRYRKKPELHRQRTIHHSLIVDGLQLIAHSYLDRFEDRCIASEVPFERRIVEGRNYVEILKELGRNQYDLIVMGAQGLGAVEVESIGSVCERVLQKSKTDILIARGRNGHSGARIMVGIDGSPLSYKALRRGIGLAKALGLRVEAVSSYDPRFHKIAFESLEGALSEEAGKIFHFKEQQQLHEEIIDSGLGKLYQRYLDQARDIGEEMGCDVDTTLLSGKPYERIIDHAEATHPHLLVVGRFGAHRTRHASIGSTTLNLARLAPCNLLIVHRNGSKSGEN